MPGYKKKKENQGIIRAKNKMKNIYLLRDRFFLCFLFYIPENKYKKELFVGIEGKKFKTQSFSKS